MNTDAPECKITQKETDDALLLVCEVEANPSVVDFQWMLDNGTYDANIVNKGPTSTISLIASPEYFGKYKCFANNSIGMSVPCERVISGKFIRFTLYILLDFRNTSKRYTHNAYTRTQEIQRDFLLQ